MNQHKEIALNSVKVLTGTFLAQVLGVVRGFMIAGFLGPAMYGFWSIFNVIIGYSLHSHLGLIHGMNKEIPFWRGKQDYEKVEKIKNLVFSVILFIALFICLSILVSSFLIKSNYSKTFLNGLRIVALIVIVHQVYIFLLSLLRADKKFGITAKSLTVFAFLSLSIISLFFLTVNNKLTGALWGLFLTYLLTNFYIFYVTKYKFKFFFDIQEIKRIFKIGFPVIAINLGYALFITIDRWMILGMIDRVNLGYYGIGITISLLIFSLSAVVASVMYPTMLEKYGETNNITASQGLVSTFSIEVAYLLTIVCGILVLFIPFLIRYIIPAYVLGTITAQILVMGIYFSSVMTISGNYLLSINQQNRIIPIQLVSIFLAISLNYIFIKMGLGIKGVALATAITYFIYGTTIVFFAVKNFIKGILQTGFFFMKLYGPFIISLGIVFILEYYLHIKGLAITRDIFATGIKMAVFGLLSLPLIFYLNKKTGVVNSVVNLIVNSIGHIKNKKIRA